MQDICINFKIFNDLKTSGEIQNIKINFWKYDTIQEYFLIISTENGDMISLIYICNFIHSDRNI